MSGARRRVLALLPAVLLAAACATPGLPDAGAIVDDATARRQILVTVVPPPPLPAQRGADSARKYPRARSYSGNARLASVARALENDYGLRQITGWPIEALGVHCYVFAIPGAAGMREVLDDLAQDARVESVQPMALFDLMGRTYDDPYFPLQTTAARMQLVRAHEITTGIGITVAVVDTAVDIAHPDLTAARVHRHRFFDGGPPTAPAMSHGTAVAGVIAATADNGIGIVGVAPGVELLALEACWPRRADRPEAVCSSYTLARAISHALRARAAVLNLSLTGPADPLLARLVATAVARGVTVVSADPGYGDAFPASLPGVIAVRADGGPGPAGGADLRGPGQQVLTLAPGGAYGYTSGSSIASAHVSGVAALLLAYRPSLDAKAVITALKDSMRSSTTTTDPVVVNACRALHAIDGPDACGPYPVDVAPAAHGQVADTPNTNRLPATLSP